jgi:protein gp37
MAENSKIEWCDHTFNPWRGCTKVSPGCANCYAETLSHRNPTVLGEWAPYFVQCTNCGKRFDQRNPPEDHTCHYKWQIRTRPRVFCASLADWLDDEVPIEWLARLMEIIMLTPNLDWLLLTKRPHNWNHRITAALAEVERITGDWPDRDPETRTGMMINDWLGENPPPNVWIGTSVEDQPRAEERISQLLSIPARIRFLSCEPLLGPVELLDTETGWPFFDLSGHPTLHWIIAGGESGHHARPMHPDWARSLRDQCQAASVPFLFKQWGEWLPGCQYQEGDRERFKETAQHSFDLDTHSWWVGKKAAGRQLDGRTWDQFPDSATPARALGETQTQEDPR